MVRGNLDLEQCLHVGAFAPGDAHCAHCDQRLECRWLYRSDEFSALARKTMEEIAEALQFAIVYVDVRVTRAGHASPTCGCGACAWLRRAQQMHDAIGIYP